MDTGVWHQVGLELSHVDVESTIESEGCSQRRDNLGDQTVKVGVGRALDVQGATADVVHGLVIDHDGDVSVLEERVSGQHRVVWLDDSGGHLGGRVHSETELGLLTVVYGQTLEEQRAETRSGTTTDSVEDKEALETSAVVSQLTDTVECEVDDFLANGVVATGVVVGSILLAGDQLFGVEQLTVGTSADLIDDGGLEIEEDATGDVLASTSLGEEGVESVIATADGLVRRHLAIRLNAVLEAVEFPAGVTYLDTGLAQMNRDDFTHD
jgi:hypothetical protein